MRRVNNELGVLILVVVMALTPLVPYAVGNAAANSPPIWMWTPDGKVYDASGQYVTISDEELFRIMGWEWKPKPRFFEPDGASLSSNSGGGDGAGSGNGGGGCR
jgi:hypothetical protein